MGCVLLIEQVPQSQEPGWEMWMTFKLSSQSFIHGYTCVYDHYGSDTTNYRDVL